MREGRTVEEQGEELPNFIWLLDEEFGGEQGDDDGGVFSFFNKESQEGKNSVLEGRDLLASGSAFLFFYEGYFSLLVIANQDVDVLDLVLNFHLYSIINIGESI